jgi:hypothetical protein
MGHSNNIPVIFHPIAPPMTAPGNRPNIADKIGRAPAPKMDLLSLTSRIITNHNFRPLNGSIFNALYNTLNINKIIQELLNQY